MLLTETDKQDLREYSDNELSFIVFNDEGLYLIRHTSFLEDYLNDIFIFTQGQLNQLKLDLIDDKVG